MSPCLCFLALLAGCAAPNRPVGGALKAGRDTPPNEATASQYMVRCPDRLEVTMPGPADHCGTCEVGLDGRIQLGSLGMVRVEGETLAQVRRELAVLADLPAEAVQVRVVTYRSQHVYLCGEGIGLRRAVPYHGPETVLALLQRCGGIEPGAEPDNVYVIRAGIAEGRSPEIFHVDLQAVVLHHDDRTNVSLEPFDQIYVGETRRSSLSKCFPRWMQPLYKALFGLRPFGGPGPGERGG